MRGLFGRQAELEAIFSALGGGLPVEIIGRPGIGKTALLRSLAYHPAAAAFADGVIYLAARQQSSGDLQQQIFDGFYESDRIRKPTAADIRHALQDKRALILVDDVHLKREELEQLLDAAPRSAFVVATREQLLHSEVRNLALHGLPVEDSLQLLEREIAHPLEEGERRTAANLCAALNGHPQRILLAAGLLRDRGGLLDAWVNDITPEKLIAESIASINQKQRRILLVLAALPGVPIPAHHIAGIAKLADIESLLAALLQRALVIGTQSGHRLADGVGDRLRRTEDLNPWINRAITYYTSWAERYRRDSHALLDESEALRCVQLQATNTRRWGEAFRLGQILEGALLAGVRWDAWAMVLEQCLLAAKAFGDQTAEAWALHEIGSRAICVGETRGARSALSEALKLRESLGDAGSAAATRQNLSFVLAPEIEPVPKPTPARHWSEFDSLPLRRGPELAFRIQQPRGGGAVAIAALLMMVLGGITYWAAGQPDLRSLDVTALRSLLAPPEAPSSHVASSAPRGRAWSEVSVQATPDVKAPAQPPSILIFTPRPGSLGPTKLCYAVAGAVRAVVEPGVGDVTPTSRLTCLRVAPARTTTYQLTALGRDGEQVRQQLVVLVR
jgi:NB-ARC domain